MPTHSPGGVLNRYGVSNIDARHVNVCVCVLVSATGRSMLDLCLRIVGCLCSVSGHVPLYSVRCRVNRMRELSCATRRCLLLNVVGLCGSVITLPWLTTGEDPDGQIRQRWFLRMALNGLLSNAVVLVRAACLGRSIHMLLHPNLGAPHLLLAFVFLQSGTGLA